MMLYSWYSSWDPLTRLLRLSEEDICDENLDDCFAMLLLYGANIDDLVAGGSNFSISALIASVRSSFKETKSKFLSCRDLLITPLSSFFIPCRANPNSAFSPSCHVLCNESTSFIYAVTECVCFNVTHLAIICSLASLG